MHRFLVVWLSLFLPALALWAQTQGRERFNVTGTVVNSATGEPVRGAQVQFNGQEQHSAMAGADGRFEVDGVPGGTTYVMAQHPGYTPNQQQPQQIIVSSAKGSVVIKLAPFSKISGRVTDREGEPIEGINVQAMSETLFYGHKQWQPAAGAQTDETGRFLIENLAAGSYVLETREAPLYVAVQPKSEAARYIYPQRFYPDAPNRELAQIIELAPGEEMRADMTLHSMRGVRVSFVTEPSHGNLYATITDGSGSGNMGAQIDVAGRMTFRGVPPGSWKIEVRQLFSAPGNNGQESLYGELPLEVGSTDIDNLKIPLSKLSDIPVVVADGDKTGITVQLFSQYGQAFGAFEQDGVLKLSSVPAGTYRVVPQPRSVCLASMTSGSVNLLQEELVIPPAGSVPPIQITSGDNCASLTVTAKTNMPASVIITTDAKAFEPQTVEISEKGFTFAGLHEGEYKVYALDDITNLEYANPDVMRNFKGQTVTLDAGQKLSVQVEVEERHPK